MFYKKEEIMGESILTSTKKLLGIEDDDTSFDLDVLIHINTALAILNQLGVGSNEGILVADKSTLWAAVLADNKFLVPAKSYVFLKVKLLFDPPLSSAAIESMNKLIAEFEWRLTVLVETPNTTS